jgi:hypothetical protein
MVIDVDTFGDEPTSERTRRQHELATEILIDNQWRVVRVQRGMSVAQAWSGLDRLGAGSMAGTA